ncbi:hypothetical protein WDW89_13810 [Deltaproteobacteria bacterium TL4]
MSTLITNIIFIVILFLNWGFFEASVFAKTKVTPLKHPHDKHYYTSPEGKLYIPESLPVFLHISSTPNPSQVQTLHKVDPVKKPVPLFLPEGANVIKNPLVEALNYTLNVDGTAPKTQILFSNAPQYRANQQLIFGRGLQVALKTEDALSGVEYVYISLDQKPYQLFSEYVPDYSSDHHFVAYYYAIDHVGNVERDNVLEFDVDVTAPATQVVLSGIYTGNILASQTQIALKSGDNLSGVSQISYQLDQNPKQTYREAILVEELAEGKHTLSYYAEDKVRNQETLKQFDFFHDLSPPEISVSVEGIHYYYNNVLYVSPQTEFMIHASDNKAGVDKVYYQFEGQPPVLYAKPFLLPQTEGMIPFNYSAIDQVKNSQEKKLRAFVDLTPPSTEYSMNGTAYRNGADMVIDSQTQISLTSVDMESGVKEIQICMNGAGCQSYKDTLGFQKDGQYEMVYYATDYVHNQENKKTLRVIVDNTLKKSKKTAAQDKLDNRWYFSEKHGLIGARGLEFFIRISDSPKEGAPSFLLAYDPKEKDPQPLFFNQHGKNKIKASAAASKYESQVTIDAIPPRTEETLSVAKKYVTTKQIFYSDGLVLSLSADDKQEGINSGVMKVLFSINGSVFAPYQSPIKQFFNEKDYIVQYYSVDYVGNAEEIHQLQFTVDVTPPKSNYAVEAPFFGKVLSSKSKIILSSRDGLSGVQRLYYFFDQGEKQIYSGPLGAKELGALSEGKHILSYYAVDNVGNQEELRSMRFALDHTPPELVSNLIGNQFIRKEQLYLSTKSKMMLRATERETELKSLLYRVDQAPFVPYQSIIPLPDDEGPHSIAFYSTDIVENQTPIQTIKFYTDTLPPKTNHQFEGVQYLNNNKLYLNGQTQIRLVASDSNAGVEKILYKYDRQFVNYSNPFSIKKSGDYTLEYLAVDSVKNKETSKTTSFFVDANPPEITISYNRTPHPSGKANVLEISTNTFIYISVQDQHIGIKDVFYQINDGTKNLYRQPITGFKRGELVKLKVITNDWVENVHELILQYEVK